MLHVFGIHMVGTRELEINPDLKIVVPVFHDGDGRVWDEIHPLFSKDTFKLLLDETGMIRGYGQVADAFSLYEDEVCHIIEVDYKQLPEDFFNPGMRASWSWFEDRGVVRRVLPDEENTAFNKVMKGALITEINEELQPLQLAEKYGEITDIESVRLKYLEKLLIKVGRIDIKGRDIVWPTLN